jgi:uncharacterized membrane-anchored protein
MKNILVIIFLIIILLAINMNIYKKEKILNNGKTILLELAPRDPRSIMQGDYMVLSYRIARDLQHKIQNKNGYLVLSISDSNVGEFVRFYSEDKELNDDEVLLRYRQRDSMLKLGAESFFFQEGHAGIYQDAKYGELKVSESGESVLVGLRDAKLNILKPKE